MTDAMAAAGNEGFTLAPKLSLAELVGTAFYVPVSIEILHLYGGWLRPWTEADFSTEQIVADYQITYPNSQVVFDKFYEAPYTTFDTLVEVVAFVVATTDVLFQVSHHRASFLEVRSGAQLHLYKLLCGLFGFDLQKAVELDELIVEHGRRYVPDISAGVVQFAAQMDGRVQAEAGAFSRAASTYTFVAHAKVFDKLLLYSSGLLGWRTTVCSSCREMIRFRGSGEPHGVVCRNCRMVHQINQLYET